MYKWPYMLILSTFITASTCYLHLKITRTDADSNIIVQHSIVERVGSKLQLTCEIEGAWYDSYHKLAWGRRTNKLRFENVADLVKLAKNGSKQLLELHELDKVYMMNKAVKTYNPLKISDRGTYFCMSLKNELFQIVRIKVKEELKCQLGEFKCGNGEKCINRDEVCDKVSHCTDESDEEWHLCREKLCIGSIRCDDHCIPTSWCCDIRIDSSCPYIVRNKCCPPIDDIFIDDKDGVYDEIPTDKKDHKNSIDVMDNNEHVLPLKPLTPAHNVILSIATAVVVLTVCLVIYFVIRECNARNSNNSRNQNGMSVPPIIRTDDNDNNSMRFTTLMGIGNSNSLEYLDLPPTYADSTRNTPINSPPSSARSSLEDILTAIDTVDHDATLPPTYDEALANLKSSNVSLSDQLESNISIFLDVPNVIPGTSRDDS